MLTRRQSLVSNNAVFNQDDCVALTSGQNVIFGNFFCNGGHGLSIGSVGGKSNNTVESITFRNSVVINSQNGCRIKTNSDTTGSIDRVTYENIAVHNISIYGVSTGHGRGLDVSGGVDAYNRSMCNKIIVSFTDVI